MFVIACILSVVIIWIFKGKLSHDEPGGAQQTLEVGVLAVRSMLEDIVGPHGLKYFPVVMTFAVLILVSNLMGLFPLFMSPTAATSVTFALGLSSFLYYNYIGISENGILNHLKHFAGPVWWIAPLIFPIELISNLIRPFSLGIRLFGNLFADEKVLETVAGIAPPWTWVGPLCYFVERIRCIYSNIRVCPAVAIYSAKCRIRMKTTDTSTITEAKSTRTTILLRRF